MARSLADAIRKSPHSNYVMSTSPYTRTAGSADSLADRPLAPAPGIG